MDSGEIAIAGATDNSRTNSYAQFLGGDFTEFEQFFG
jgi:hypothetical protein